MADGAMAALDVQLPLATQNESLNVTVEVPGVETASSQVGETITAAKMTSVPLNGRSFTDLLAMQPGVIPASSQQPNAVVMSGCTGHAALGRSQSRQSFGQRTARNQQRLRRQRLGRRGRFQQRHRRGSQSGFHPGLQGAHQQLRRRIRKLQRRAGAGHHQVRRQSTSRQRLRIRCATPRWTRATTLPPAAPPTSATSTAAPWADPIRKDKSFFFLDYQGTGMTQGQETGNIAVPSLAERGGNFSDLVSPQSGASPLTGTVSGAYLASQLPPS